MLIHEYVHVPSQTLSLVEDESSQAWKETVKLQEQLINSGSIQPHLRLVLSILTQRVRNAYRDLQRGPQQPQVSGST